MDSFPSLVEAQTAVKKMRLREEKEQRVFPPSVDPEEAATCHCQCCPPRSSQEQGEYCCSSLFSLPLLRNGTLLKDGLLSKMKEVGSHCCITKDPLFKDHILTEAAARASAEMFSMFSGEPITDFNKAYRYGSYRLFVASTIGHLGKGVRIRLPACFIHAVRQLWPSTSYRGFSSSEANDV